MTHYQLVSQNKRKSFLVLVGFGLFVVFVSWIFYWFFDSSLTTLGLFLIFVGIGSFIAYWNSDKIVLASTKAKPAKRQDYFDFYTVVENLAMSQRLPKPKIYVIKAEQANAFATGRNPKHAVVVATTGLLKQLNRSELEGVMAHELSHIKNYDILLMTLVTVFIGFILIVIDIIRRNLFFGSFEDNDKDNEGIKFFVSLILVLIVPVVTKLIQLAISRKREFLADASAVAITKNPQGLINALKKLSAINTKPLRTAGQATAHLFIVDPLTVKVAGKKKFKFANLFDTHPPIEARVAALEKLVS